MYENPKFNQNNEKILCERNGKNSDMLMDIRVKILKAGETMTFCEAENETALLLMAGDVDFVFDEKNENAKRRSPFLDKATAIHFARNNTVTVKANEESRFVIEQTDNSNDFGVHYYKGEDMTVQHFGADQWDGTADRQVLTVFDYENAPYSNLVLGEVFHKPGCWTSYPPHYHPQPEVYYYEFDKPQGFGKLRKGCPKEQGAVFRRQLRHGQGAKLVNAHGGIVIFCRALHLSLLIAPRRVCVNDVVRSDRQALRQ